MNNVGTDKRSSLLKKIKDSSFLEGSFTTRAGEKTNYYIDKYRFETKPELLDSICNELLPLFPDPHTYDRIAAPELGAVPLAAVLSIKLMKPFIIVKKSSKEYGTQNLIEGLFKDGESVVLLEDILTSGGTAIKSCDVLLKHHLKIVHTVAVIDREEGAQENMKKQGYTYDALYTKSDLFNC
ncbi:MAG: orotate phosphoribosyltransferase [Candidatus Margulisbacteria bacterium]|nr:orotate phosphoribosyltransferase [Candidatus Margulisiibacteriota bacterium]